MKKCSLLSLLVISVGFANEETSKWAKEAANRFIKEGWNQNFLADDLLPDRDKGKEFNPQSMPLDESKTELHQFVQNSLKKERIEEQDQSFQLSSQVLRNPRDAAGIQTIVTQEVPEEELLISCREGGTYQISFRQNRKVVCKPPIKQQIHHCLGHSMTEKFSNEKEAKAKRKTLNSKFSNDSTVASFKVNIEEKKVIWFSPTTYYVLADWIHKQNSCNHVRTEEVTLEPSFEQDQWDTDFPAELAVIESNPDCRLLYSQVLVGPDHRMINGNAIFRDIWSRQLFFSCEPTQESPCVKLRANSGVLMSRKCLRENRFGECELWEKTYDLGKRAALIKTTPTFIETPLPGLDDQDISYEKNKELSSVLPLLGVFSDIKKEKMSQQSHDIEIFRGEKFQCACSFVKGVLYDCCRKMEGIAISTYLAKCTSEEQALAGRRHEGHCHHIGSKKENLGTQTTQVFCCFPTKLAKVLHEQGRNQLNIEWGSPDEPNCRGFNLLELQKLDFYRIDFSEVVEDLSIEREEILRKVRNSIEAKSHVP